MSATLTESLVLSELRKRATRLAEASGAMSTQVAVLGWAVEHHDELSESLIESLKSRLAKHVGEVIENGATP